MVFSACQNQGVDNKAAVDTNANVSANTTSKPDAKTVEEIKEMLAKHDKALNDKDLDGVMATYSNNPNAVLLGTGEGERYVGTDTIRQAYTEIFKDYDAGTLGIECDWKNGGADPSGNMAWAGASCKYKDSLNGKAREFVMNVSAAFVKEEGAWHFIVLHMSNAPSGLNAPGAGPAPSPETKE